MKKILFSATLSLIAITYTQAQNLVLHYSLDDLSATVGPTGDLLPYGTGTAANIDSAGALNTPGEHSASFYHGAGYVSTSVLNNVGWTGTALSFWYKSQATYQGALIQGAYLGFGSRILSNGHVEATFDGSAAGSYYSTVAINDGEWHHIVIQNNGTTTEIYIDGELNNSGSETLYTLSSGNSNAKIYLGNHINDNITEKIYGQLDEIKVFDNVLSQSEIDNLYAYSPCVVTIPDANFRAYLLGNSAINTNGNTEIECSEAEAYTSQIWVQNLSISDLTGIEAFVNLTSLNCNTNSLNSINLSSNTHLVILNIAGNNISTLDLSNLGDLYDLNCDYNDIAILDVSQNPNLGKLNCNNNSLINLDLSLNTALFQLGCESNLLESLNVKNGNNTNVTAFYAGSNPNLECIEVDNAVYSTANWTNIDANSSFNENCNGTASIQETGSNELIQLYPNPALNVLNITVSTNTEVKIVNVFGETLSTIKVSTGTNAIDISTLSKGIYFIQTESRQAVKFVHN